MHKDPFINILNNKWVEKSWKIKKSDSCSINIKKRIVCKWKTSKFLTKCTNLKRKMLRYLWKIKWMPPCRPRLSSTSRRSSLWINSRYWRIRRKIKKTKNLWIFRYKKCSSPKSRSDCHNISNYCKWIYLIGSGYLIFNKQNNSFWWSS